jgi:hypothetical protein
MFPNARVVVLINADRQCLNFGSESRIRNEMNKETPELQCFSLVKCYVNT